jgi:hypothetical protein
MAVPRIEYANTAGKIDVTPAVDVPDLGILGALGVDVVHVRHAARHSQVATGEKVSILRHFKSALSVLL